MNNKKEVSVEQVKLAGQLLKREHEARLQIEKEASDLKLEKRAMKVAFREVELGLSQPFKTHGEFMDKVANLVKEDLDVIEKALERGYGHPSQQGELAEDSGKIMNSFQRWVLNGELD